ncbi:MAG: type II toxin-antitoxin system VapC family toxin [Propionibacteriaceae bacterium]|nr:type II toxin-antitoxin system VapC family toxin [Propionibacteriaceae bacterium]
MIGIDTNVLIRHITADDPHQSPIVQRLIDTLTPQHQSFISLVVLVETYWTLRRRYGLPREEADHTINALLSAAEYKIDEEDLVRAALAVARETTLELPDIVISLRGKAVGCTTTYTFDKKASELEGMTLLT